MAGTLTTTTLLITPEMLGIIAELDEFKGAWRALSTLAPERLLVVRRVAAIESIGASTRLEGCKLSEGCDATGSPRHHCHRQAPDACG
jgi:hypothetical protein